MPYRFVLLLLSIFILIGCVRSSSHEKTTHLKKNHLHAQTAKKDLWVAMRKSFKLKDYSHHPEVRKHIRWYMARPQHLKNVMEHASPYIQHVFAQTQERNLPAELALIPFVESNYNPFAFSKAGALGLWQLMPGTASGFGLLIDWWYDGRRDLIASTDGALNYLTYLHRFFKGNWLYAVAAYDSGEGTVQRAVRKKHQQKHSAIFWQLKLPKETKDYVPRLLALKAIIEHPKRYHITLPPIDSNSKLKSIKLTSQIDLHKLAELAGISSEKLYALNSGYRRRIVPPGSQHILVPKAQAQKLQARLMLQPKNQRTQWRSYEVKTGGSLSHIAKQHNTTVALLKRVNNIDGDQLKKHQTILVPAGFAKPLKPISTQTKTIMADRLPGPKRTVHYSKKNDNLSGIAKHYGVKISQIRYWNKLRGDNSLKKGQEIVLWRSPKKQRWKKHTIKSGDSLIRLAKHYHSSVKEIKLANGLKNSQIRIGKQLKIPV